jgi:predicted GNAT family N-acyltransferase
VDGTPVATARWRAVTHDDAIVAKLERFAVLPAHRGNGYGHALVEAVLDDARRAGFDTFLLHAQAHLEDWYASFGFRSTGRRFEEAGIPHVEMVRNDGT